MNKKWLLILLILPMFVSANVSYNKGVKNANDYISSFKNNSKYILNINDSNNVKFLNINEYDISKDDVGKSYLAIGPQFWLKDYYVLDWHTTKVDTEYQSSVRVTEYVKHNVKVTGKGTQIVPWEFIQKYIVSVVSSNEDYGTIDERSKQQEVDFLEDANVYFYLKKGYMYVGNTYDNSSNVVTENNINKITLNQINDDLYIKLDFKPINYNIIYNSNGGTNSMEKTVCTYDKECKLSNNKFERNGWTFTGWNTKQNGTGMSFLNGGSANNLTSTNNANITLYAQWKQTEYTITFDPNGGNAFTSATCPTNKFNLSGTTCSSAIKVGTPYGNLPTPTRAGYIFKGWSTKNNGTVDVSTSTKPNSTSTLYAVWSICGKGYYSSDTDASCIKCPTCKTTASAGSTSSSACIYNEGDKANNTKSLGWQDNICVCSEGNCTTNLFNGKSKTAYTSYANMNYAVDCWNFKTSTHGYCPSSPTNDILSKYGFHRYWLSAAPTPGNGSIPVYSATDMNPNNFNSKICNQYPLNKIDSTNLNNPATLKAGNNNIAFNVSGGKTVYIVLRGGGYMTGLYFSSLKFTVNGTDKTLKQLVDENIVMPIVIMSPSGYVNNNVLNMYTGGSTTTGNWPDANFIFTLRPGYKITNLKVYVNKTMSGADGLFTRTIDSKYWSMYAK